MFVAVKLMFLELTVSLAGVVGIPQHTAVNCTLVSGGVPAVLEPVVCHDDGRGQMACHLHDSLVAALYPCSGTLPVQTP